MVNNGTNRNIASGSGAPLPYDLFELLQREYSPQLLEIVLRYNKVGSKMRSNTEVDQKQWLPILEFNHTYYESSKDRFTIPIASFGLR
jgi:hypothetical protein